MGTEDLAGLTFRGRDEAWELLLHCRPGKPHTRMTGIHGDRLALDLAAAPERGKANETLIAFLSEALALPRARVELLRGTTSKDKTVRILGLNRTELLARLARHFPRNEPS